MSEPTAPKPDYSNKKYLDEQIAMAEAELHVFEMQCASQINFRRGTINAMQAIRDGKAIVTKQPEPPPPA